MDGSSEELTLPHLEVLSSKLGLLMKQGISIQKENAVTAFATSVVSVGAQFDKHFAEALDLLL